MDQAIVNELVAEWDDVYKKGQLSLWILLSLFEGKKYSAEISQFMYDATDGYVEVKEQSLYRALRRFKAMAIVAVVEEDSPNSGPKRKFYYLTEIGSAVLAEFVRLHIAPLRRAPIDSLLCSIQEGGLK